MQKQYSHEDVMNIMKTAEDLERTLDVSVKISHGQVLQVVVNDLVAKYKSCVQRKDDDNIKAFERVLHYYLSEEEFIELTK